MHPSSSSSTLNLTLPYSIPQTLAPSHHQLESTSLLQLPSTDACVQNFDHEASNQERPQTLSLANQVNVSSSSKSLSDPPRWIDSTLNSADEILEEPPRKKAKSGLRTIIVKGPAPPKLKPSSLSNSPTRSLTLYFAESCHLIDWLQILSCTFTHGRPTSSKNLFHSQTNGCTL